MDGWMDGMRWGDGWIDDGDGSCVCGVVWGPMGWMTGKESQKNWDGIGDWYGIIHPSTPERVLGEEARVKLASSEDRGQQSFVNLRKAWDLDTWTAGLAWDP